MRHLFFARVYPLALLCLTFVSPFSGFAAEPYLEEVLRTLDQVSEKKCWGLAMSGFRAALKQAGITPETVSGRMADGTLTALPKRE